MENKQVTYFNLANSLVIRLDGKTYTLHKTDHRYPKIQEAIESKNFENLFDLIDPTRVLNQQGLEVKSGVVYFKGEPIPTILGDQFLEFKIDQISFMALLNFWLNLKNRTDFEGSREHIITLLQQKGYPVTEDGFVIAYKDETDGVATKFDARKKIVTPFFNYSKTNQRIKAMFDKKKTLNQMLEEVFGFCSKKLVKLATEKVFKSGNPYVSDDFFNYGIAFKGILSPNNLFTVIEKGLYPCGQGTIGQHSNMNDFWQEFAKTKEGQISEKKILNLLGTKFHAHNLLMCGDMWHHLKGKAENISLEHEDFTANVEKIFRYLEREVKKLKNPEFDLKITENFPQLKELEAAKLEGFNFVLPKTNYDLAEWSRIMKNCIGTHGYDKSVLNGKTIVFAIVDATGKMRYNLEIVDGKVRQFRSYHNGRPEKEDYEKIMDILLEKEIIYTLECDDVRF